MKNLNWESNADMYIDLVTSNLCIMAGLFAIVLFIGDNLLQFTLGIWLCLIGITTLGSMYYNLVLKRR